MEPASTLPTLLMVAWLLPLASFVLILFFGRRMGPAGKYAGHVATGAIAASCLLSLSAMFVVWLPNHHLVEPTDHETTAGAQEATSHGDSKSDDNMAHPPNGAGTYYAGDWYTLYPLGDSGKLKLTIGYYIDTLTITMFCMVTLIASCVHLYATGYMHDELHDFTDPEVTLTNGQQLKRRGRYYRFFQYLSLFSFSMLGVVIAGNLAMIFVFWELVGICSYFLIGFYIERKSACNAANKAFIVNRIGDFGMLIGMMALWSSLGTFSFGDLQDVHGQPVLDASGQLQEPGIFSLLRSEQNDYRLVPSDGMIADAHRDEVESIILAQLAQARSDPDFQFQGATAVAEAVGQIQETKGSSTAAQWLLLVAGVGIFCGCVGKSAQFPLHVWLPDAMEGPTPVSALVHSATMVAAGVYLVGRFYPVFSPEALLVIAYVGCITLLLAATIAITATDIKRVLAYSTVSQLGYMMLALGIGGWVAGLFHLLTHAFFKGLLFLCSGSVIHAVHTNEMTEMGGLRKKMPITAYTMLVGCLAIIGAGIPLSGIGLSGYYSKDAIIEQALSFGQNNPGHKILMIAPIAGALLTAFYMFRLWYMTFAGKPRDPRRYNHAHESPRSMTIPLITLALFAVSIGWQVPFTKLKVTNLLEQARPVGTLATTHGQLMPELVIPNEHHSHEYSIRLRAGLWAFATAATGVLLATLIYFWNILNPRQLQKVFWPLRQLLWNKWWFDELYHFAFVIPTHLIATAVAKIDQRIIDPILHALAAICRAGARLVDLLMDQTVVDGSVNMFARGTWDLGLALRKVQTGKLRQYILLIVVCTVVLFVAIVYLPLFSHPS
jgi:NADH-quinone oxidoreductase subunit L